jgi:hypothetical protein
MALAFLVVGCAMALVFDSLWLRTAAVKVQQAADAAALAAASQLATDELLLPGRNEADLAARARLAAAELAARNLAGGQPVYVDSAEGGDVALGRIELAEGDGEPRFVVAAQAPTTAVVFTHCNRATGNPIALFFPHLTGQAWGDVTGRAEASINNRLIALRPLDAGNIPALPLAILERHDDPERTDTWERQIDAQQGVDAYSFDRSAYSVRAGGDGLHEMRLQSTLPGNEEEEAKRGNVHLIDIGTGLKPGEMLRQIESGWNWQDLRDWGGEFRISHSGRKVGSNEHCSGDLVEGLRKLVGQTRIVPLYCQATPGGRSGSTSVTLTRLVAVRILNVEGEANALRMTIQPAVLATRTAIVSESLNSAPKIPLNPYIYRLSLTY